MQKLKRSWDSEPIGTYLISKMVDGSYKYYYKNAMGFCD